MSAKGWTGDEAQLALHHDGLSRLFALAGLSHLSTRHSKSFGDVLSGKDGRRRNILDLQHPLHHLLLQQEASSSSSSTNSLHDDGLGALPIWTQIHNRRCLKCENPLFLGVNCRSEKNGQVKCMICKSLLEREEEPKREVKRLYRSVRTRQNLRESTSKSVGMMMKGSVVAKSTTSDGMQVDTIEANVDNVSVHPETLTSSKYPGQGRSLLQQRAAEIKKKAKEKKKMALNDDKKVLEEVKEGEMLAGVAATKAEGVERQVNNKRKERPTPSQQDEMLRQMLAQKRAKRQEEEAAKSPSQAKSGDRGGLLDFLSSLG